MLLAVGKPDWAPGHREGWRQCELNVIPIAWFGPLRADVSIGLLSYWAPFPTVRAPCMPSIS